jgi:hypothetical protein
MVYYRASCPQSIFASSFEGESYQKLSTYDDNVETLTDRPLAVRALFVVRIQRSMGRYHVYKKRTPGGCF